MIFCNFGKIQDNLEAFFNLFCITTKLEAYESSFRRLNGPWVYHYVEYSLAHDSVSSCHAASTVSGTSFSILPHSLSLCSFFSVSLRWNTRRSHNKTYSFTSFRLFLVFFPFLFLLFLWWEAKGISSLVGTYFFHLSSRVSVTSQLLFRAKALMIIAKSSGSSNLWIFHSFILFE